MVSIRCLRGVGEFSRTKSMPEPAVTLRKRMKPSATAGSNRLLACAHSPARTIAPAIVGSVQARGIHPRYTGILHTFVYFHLSAFVFFLTTLRTSLLIGLTGGSRHPGCLVSGR